ncbi:MAG: galactokinase [Planctomycetota bacterium]
MHHQPEFDPTAGLENPIGFFRSYGGTIDVLAGSPGRVNLIGDHIDYCGGTVLPMAIERFCFAAVISGECDPGTCVVSSLDHPDNAVIDVGRPITAETAGAAGGWTRYVLGVAAQIQRRHPLGALGGCRVAVKSTVPIGAGLSSSAALEVSVALAMLGRIGFTLGGLGLAEMCRRAEHEFAGVPCGLMDQAAVVLAEAGNALELDCATRRHRQVRLPDQIRISIIDSKVRHTLADGEYRRRQEACEHAARLLGVQDLAHAPAGAGDKMPDEYRRYVRHVQTEQARVIEFVRSFEDGNIERAGALMWASHASLRDDYRVSCEPVDAIVESLAGRPGIVGARMTGGGFGGCVVVMHTPDAEDEVTNIAQRCAPGESPLPVITTRAAEGAKQLPTVPR